MRAKAKQLAFAIPAFTQARQAENRPRQGIGPSQQGRHTVVAAKIRPRVLVLLLQSNNKSFSSQRAIAG